MAHTHSSVLRLSALATCVASAVSFSALANNWTEQPVEVLMQSSVSDKLTNKNTPQFSQHFPTYYIVQLDSPSLVMAASELPGALNHQITNGNRLNLSARSAQDYAAQLQREQQSFVSALESNFSDVQIQRSLHVTINGLIVAFNGNVDYRARLAAMPGVKAVYEHKMYHASTDASLELINQPQAAAMLGGEHRAGEGVKVAIIDSGIRPENPMFASNGHVRPNGLPNDDYCSTVDASFCNDKLALARYYAPTFTTHPDEYMSPLDLSGHGTHVAGTAVGNAVVADYNNVAISGVAPGATLMVYKALFRTPTASSGSNIMLTSAFEDAIADGADVINNSWGGGPGENSAHSPYTAIFDAAKKAGVVIVSAAGAEADFQAIPGTSMASSHVAGAAALLLQQNPDLDAHQIKSTLMPSTTSMALADDGSTPATPFSRGAGRIDLAAATNTAIWFDGPSLNSTSCNVTCSFERTAYNLLDIETEWRSTVTFWDQDVSVELSETEITLAANNGEANFKLDVDVRSAEPGWKLGEIIWTSLSGNYAPARMLVVIHAGLSDNSHINQTSFISPFEFGTPVQLRSHAWATDGPDSLLSFLVEIPDGVELDVDSIQISTHLATETDFSVAADQRSFSWEGEVNNSPTVASVGPASSSVFPYPGLSLVDVGLDSNDVNCASACDEIVTELDVSSYGLIHNGQPIDSLFFSENGLTAADARFLGSYVTKELPTDLRGPYNVIAPFWADFIFGPSVGGRVIHNVIHDAVNSWLVIEWHGVVPFSGGSSYTFSQWMKLNSDEIYFNYIDMPNQLNGSVGIENADGTAGASYYYNGSGTFPSNDSALSASIQPGQAGFVQIDYEITADHFGQSRGAELETLWGADINVNLGALFSTRVDDNYVRSVVQSNNLTYESFLLIDLSAQGAVTVDIVSAPENGSLTPSGSASPYEYIYTPNSGFVGEDIFIYQAVDAEGNTTARATVTIDVVNNAPTASASAPTRADGGDVVTLDARGSSDPDGDQLTYSWAQTSGLQVTLSSTSASTATFEAPNQDGTVSFTVTVSDGNLTDTALVSVTIAAVEPPPVEPPPVEPPPVEPPVVEPPVVEESRSKRKWYKGSFGGSLALVGLSLVWLRRRAIKVHD